MTTRARAAEAVTELWPHLEQGLSVKLDLEGDIVSMSFLDEVVRRLLESGRLDQVVFSIHSQDVLDKLARIADVRHAPIVYMGVDTKVPIRITGRPSDLLEWSVDKAAS